MLRCNLLSVLMILAGIVIYSCSAKTPDSTHNSRTHRDTKDTAATVTSDTIRNIPDKTILFFMNPNGRPCQMQNEILTDMKEELASVATVVYVKTTESKDREKFYTYGIRGLPSLVVVDKNGKEITRFSPGIQSRETILGKLR